VSRSQLDVVTPLPSAGAIDLIAGQRGNFIRYLATSSAT